MVAVHLWRHLVEAVVEHGLCLLHGLHELCHFGVWHGHGFKLLAAFEVAILKQWHACHYGVELLAAEVHEYEVGHIGHVAHHSFAKFHIHALLHGDEYAAAELGHGLEELVGGLFGVRSCQVAEHVPWGVGYGGWIVHLDKVFIIFYQMVPIFSVGTLLLVLLTAF